jgi:hypothetical protein
MTKPNCKYLEVVSLVTFEKRTFEVKTEGFVSNPENCVSFIDADGIEHSIWTTGNVLYHVSSVMAF